MSDELGPAFRTPHDALEAVLRVHNMVVSGGFSHALDPLVLSSSDLDSAVRGFQYFGADRLTLLIARAAQADPDDDNAIDELDAEYDRLVPNDQYLEDLYGLHRDDASASEASV